MSPDFDRHAAQELRKIDLIYMNEDLSRTFKPFYLGLALLLFGCLIGFATYFTLPPISINKLNLGVLLSVVMLLIFAKYYLKILWRIKSKAMQQEDFDILMKWSQFEAKNQKRILSSTSVIFGMLIVFLGGSFTLTFVALLLTFLGLFFLLFSVTFLLAQTYF